MKILLATDGSDYSKAAIKELAQRTFPSGTEVRIVSAYEWTPVMTIMNQWSQKYYAEADRNILKSAKDNTENAAKILRKKNPPLTVTTSAIEGYPKSVILTEAEKFGADLIVVGSHGRGTGAGFLAGPVSQSVGLHAKCSVEIIRKRNTKQVIPDKQIKKMK